MSQTENAATIHAEDGESGILSRPSEILNRLSDEGKWEVTRRHPYYQLYWRSARADESDGYPWELTEGTRFILTLIGVVGEYPPPETPFGDLVQNAVGRAWLQGAISRVSVRSLLMMLERSLPADVKRTLAAAFNISASIEPQDARARYGFVEMIRNAADLDLLLPELVFTVNPHAADRSITTAITEVVQAFRTENNIPVSRRREDCFADYLTVWDRREGWNGSTYEYDRRMSLKDVAQELEIPSSTAMNHYRSAFQAIVGHPYQIDRYLRTMGLFFTHRLTSRGLQRPLNARTRRPVPDTTLNSGNPAEREGGARSVIWTNEFTRSDMEAVDMINDVRALLDRGKTAEQISQELELDCEAANEIIAYVQDLPPNAPIH